MLPTLNVAIIDVGITQSGETLSANATNLDSYQWINCATLQPVSGATGTTFTPQNRGFYAVAVSLNNCLDTSACVPIGMEGLEVDELAAAGTVKYYPNPALDRFVVERTDGSTIGNIALYSMLGAVVYQAAPQTAQHIIAVSELPAGMYLIRIETPKGAVTGRMEIAR